MARKIPNSEMLDSMWSWAWDEQLYAPDAICSLVAPGPDWRSDVTVKCEEIVPAEEEPEPIEGNEPELATLKASLDTGKALRKKN